MSARRLTRSDRLTDCPSCGLAVAVELHGHQLAVRCLGGCDAETLEGLDVAALAAELAEEGMMASPFADPLPEPGFIDLSPEEVATVERIREEWREKQNGAGTAASAPAIGRAVVLTAASAIAPEALSWLWDRRLPLRGLSLIAGEPGLGKSTLTAELAADVTRGRLDGDLHGGPRDVLIASAEDHFASVVWGRLTAAGADMGRVHRVTVEGQDGEELLTLPDDVAEVEQRCEELAARGRPVALVAIDPVTAFIGASVDTHRDAAVRRVLAPLAGLAERQRLAAVGVAHLNKDTAGKLLSRVGGSVAFGAAPRSVLAFARHPDDPDGEQGAERVIVQAKSNQGRFAPSLAARIEARVVPPVGEVSRLVVDGECEVGPDDLAPRGGEHHERDAAAEWLADELADGEWHESREVKARAKAAGHSERTVERARSLLGAERDRRGFPSVAVWRLPVPPTPTTATGGTVGGETEQTRTTSGIEPVASASPATSPGGGGTGESEALATPALEAEIERVRAKFPGLDSSAEPLDTAAVEEGLARAKREQLSGALPAPSCACDGPLRASDGSCVRCGREAP